MRRRARLLAVVAIVATGALGVISSTQTWLTVTLTGGAHGDVAVPGASAIPVLAPLSLALLALGLALSIVGPVLRYVFGVLAVGIGVVLGIATWAVVAGPSTHHVAAGVTEVTGITGDSAVSALVERMASTPWPAVTLAGWLVLLAAGILVLATAHAWRGGGRRYRTDAASALAQPSASRPHDAIDDWDDLSRGSDPTAR